VTKIRARLSAETAVVRPKPAAKLRIALAYPNTYRVGISSLGYQIVYRLFNALPEVSCERVFLPDPTDLREYLRTGMKLFSLETQTPVADFDVLAFSLAFELDYVNALRILELSGIPLYAFQRSERHPLVIAGGVCATFNPEPMADFVDCFVIGDAENVVARLANTLITMAGQDKADRLAALAKIEGIYVPSFYTPEYGKDGSLVSMKANYPAPVDVKRSVCRDLSSHPGDSVIITAESEFGAARLVEVERGCGRGCRFCVTGYINRPPRLRNLEAYLQHSASFDATQRYGLVGSAVFDHPDAFHFCRQLLAHNLSFSVASLRLETVTQEVASLLAASGQKTLTIAPEAGTERLRRVIGKACFDEQIDHVVNNARRAGLERVRLYFMIGLPTESEHDIDSIATLTGELAGKYYDLDFEVSVSSFVPKPWTPFQWHPMAKESTLRNRLLRLRKALQRIPNVNLSAESPRLSVVQGLLARGDRRLSRMLELAVQYEGDYRAALRDSQIDLDWYIYRHRDQHEVFPWDHIVVDIDKDWLWREYQRALTASAG
jgi:radical SAM superfamily enzyme YgiQ (UPF0313 family)